MDEKCGHIIKLIPSARRCSKGIINPDFVLLGVIREGNSTLRTKGRIVFERLVLLLYLLPYHFDFLLLRA